MGYQLRKSISLSQVLRDIGYQGFISIENDINLHEVAQAAEAGDSCLCFSSALLDKEIGAVVFIKQEVELPEKSKNIYLPSNNPRLDFIKALDYLYTEIGFSHFDFPSEVHPSVKMGKNVVIEDGCRIAEGVVLEHNVVIHSGTTIGKNSRIRANSSIGGDGFGFERLDNGMPIRFQHLGGVEIGEYVEIGSNSCIVRGTLSNTIIKDYVKVDNLVHLAHNCIVEEGAMIIACAEVSGGVRIGRNAWIGPNAAIIQKVSIGENALIGIGSTLTKSVGENDIWAGNPARILNKK